MIRKLLDNIEIKVICLFLAIVMWLYASDRTDIVNRARTFITRGERGVITFHDVPVEFTGSKEVPKLTAEPAKVSISINCSTDADINLSELSAKVKITRKDKDRIFLSEDNVILPEGLRFIRSEPREIRIKQKRNPD
jgi:YbbR domain-containing protein